MAVSEDAVERSPDGRRRVSWADPSDQVRAVLPRVVRNGEGRDPLDRYGRVKTERLWLVANDPPARDATDLTLGDSDWNWVLGADRRGWDVVRKRWGTGALDVAMALVSAGVVELDVHTAPAGRRDHRPAGWVLSSQWSQHRKQRVQQRENERLTVAREASDLADEVEGLDRSLAQALRATAGHTVTTRVLLAAGRDLLDGVAHDGPRAFSQVHFENTKAREDAHKLLRDAGVSDETITRLGLARSPHVGLGGALVVPGLDLTMFAGPVRLRATGKDWGTRLGADATALVLVENLQAAETVCDRFGDVAVIWFAGQPADTVLDVCRPLTHEAADRGIPVLLAPDADLGGVYIARRLAPALRAGHSPTVIDVGQWAPAPTRAFSATSQAALVNLAQDPNPWVARFAGDVLERGFPVEQEAAIRRGLAATLTALRADRSPRGSQTAHIDW